MKTTLLPCHILAVFLLLSPAIQADAKDSTSGSEQSRPNISELFSNHPALDKGVLLIANHSLHDPNFRQTVILITEFSETGTVGLIINRPLQLSADKVFPHINKITAVSGNLHVGGPVGINKLQFLIRTATALHLSDKVFADVYLVNTPKAFASIFDGAAQMTTVRLYAGYAGWAAGQLESELMRGDWYLWHADNKTVFSDSPESVWPELIQKASAQWVDACRVRTGCASCLFSCIIPALDDQTALLLQ